MRFLITANSPVFGPSTRQSPFVRFRDARSNLSLALADNVDVWIADGQEVTNALLDQLRANPTPVSLLVKDTTILLRFQAYVNGALVVAPFPQPATEEAILQEAEKLYTNTRTIYTAKDTSRRTVLLVGAGVINLMTAEHLAENGYQVHVVEAGPDPRIVKDWTQHGVTNCGGNARMFTYTEGDNYNDPEYQYIFRKAVREGGWSVKSPKDFSPEELDFVHAHEVVPGWMSKQFRADMFAINTEGGRLWKDYVRQRPQLFQDDLVQFAPEIIRLYEEKSSVQSAMERNRGLGSLIKPADEFNLKFPYFRNIPRLGGGVTVDGFTVNIHPFQARLLERIAQLGGRVTWNTKVEGLNRNAAGEVVGLQTAKGSLVADHYVVSPGTGGNDMLAGTKSHNKIQGVLGIWLQVPNIDANLVNSIKVHRNGYKVEDINITVAKDPETGEDILQFGGAYGYVGLDYPALDNPELMALFDEMEFVAESMFPRGYAAAKKADTLFPGGHRKFCVRPWTSTGLTIFETIPSASGGVAVINGGNNTGGFAQATAIAQAVRRALVGEHDAIHSLCHPERGLAAAAVTDQFRTPAAQFASAQKALQGPSPSSRRLQAKL